MLRMAICKRKGGRSERGKKHHRETTARQHRAPRTCAHIPTTQQRRCEASHTAPHCNTAPRSKAAKGKGRPGQYRTAQQSRKGRRTARVCAMPGREPVGWPTRRTAIHISHHRAGAITGGDHRRRGPQVVGMSRTQPQGRLREEPPPRRQRHRMSTSTSRAEDGSVWPQLLSSPPTH